MSGFIYKLLSTASGMDNDPSSWFSTVPDKMSKMSKDFQVGKTNRNRYQKFDIRIEEKALRLQPESLRLRQEQLPIQCLFNKWM